MKKLSIVFNIILVAFAAVFFLSCGGPTPSVIFMSPKNGEEFYKDEDISIKLKVADVKGKEVTVRLYAEELLLTEITDGNYDYDIPAGIIKPGKHTIKAIAETKTGKTGEGVREIIINNENFQSDSYVSFFTGDIPPQWKAIEWNITFGGMDDLYCISTNVTDNIIYTPKNCNKISFYLQGWGLVKFMINNNVFAKIDVRASDFGPGLFYDQKWKRYEFTFPKGLHSFSWILDFYDDGYGAGGHIDLDQIIFSTVE